LEHLVVFSRGIYDAAGGAAAISHYDPYGNLISAGAMGSSFGFAGEHSDPSGLQYLRARYYDPMTGSFISRDPLGRSVGSASIEFNKYLYANANPVNFTDPSGKFAISAWLVGVAIVAIAGLIYYATNPVVPNVDDYSIDVDLDLECHHPHVPPDIPNFNERFPADYPIFEDFIESYPDERLRVWWNDFILRFPDQISWNNFLLEYPDAQRMWNDWVNDNLMFSESTDNFENRLSDAVKDRYRDDEDLKYVIESWELVSLSNPHELANLDPTLPENSVQKRYQAEFEDVFGEKYYISINYDVTNGQFGIIKESSGKDG